MKNFTMSFASITLLFLTQPAQSQTAPSESREVPEIGKPYVPLYGLNVGYERISSSRTRATFGDGLLNITPAFGPAFSKKGLMVLPGVSVLLGQKDGLGGKNKALLVSLGPSFRYGFSDPFSVEMDDAGKPKLKFRSFAPYVQVTPGVFYQDLRIESQNLKQHGFTIGATLSTGVAISKNAYVQGNTRFMREFKSYQFNTFGIECGVRF